jgi:Na+/proline symporter
MSSISSGINSVSAVVLTDFYGGSPDESARDETAKARRYSMITGLVVTAAAFFVAAVVAAGPDAQNITDIANRAFNLFVGPLGGLFIAGMFLPHVGSRAAYLATLLGLLFAVIISFYGSLFNASAVPSTLFVMPSTALVTFVLAGVLGLMMPRPDPDRVAGHTWWTRATTPAKLRTSQ